MQPAGSFKPKEHVQGGFKMKKDDGINWKLAMFTVVALLSSILIGLWTIRCCLDDVRSILYDIRTQNEYREIVK